MLETRVIVKENDELALEHACVCVNTPLLVHSLVCTGLSASRSPGNFGPAFVAPNS